MSNMFLNVVSTFKGDGLSAATRQLGAFGKSAGGLGSTLGKAGAALASFGLATKAVAFTKESIDSARDLERNLFSVGTIFDEFAPKIVQFTKNAEQLGLSQKDAAKASTFLGSVLKQSGFSMDFVTAETQKLVSLGVDLAATYGYDVQEALLGMTALFRGEYDPIEKFGVAMKQSEINSELAARGLNDLEGAARRNAEQTIRLELLYQRAADATGAFTAQSGNLYVEQKKLSAAWENMKATVGTELLPAMGGLVEVLKPLVDELTPRLVQVVTDAQPAIQTLTQLIKDMGDTTTTTGATVSAFADIFGTAFRLISENFGVLLQLTTLLLGVRLAITLVTTAMAVFTAHPIIATLTLLAAGFILVNDAANNLRYTVDTTGKSVTSFNTALKNTGKEGDYVRKKYGVIGVTFQKASAEARRLSTEVANADKAKLDNLKAQILGIKFSSREATNEIRRMREQAGLPAIEEKAAASAVDPDPTGGGAKAAGKKAGGNFVGSFQNAINEFNKAFPRKWKELATKFLDANAVKPEWTEFGSKLGNTLINGLRKNIEKRRLGLQFLKPIYEQATKLQDAFAARTQYQVKLKEDIMGMFDFKDVKNGLSGIIKQFKDQVEQTKKFKENLAELQKLGLSGGVFQKIVEGQDFNTAAELVKGGAAAVGEVNTLFGQLTGFADEIATISGNQLYNLGVDAATGFTRTLEDGFGTLDTLYKKSVSQMRLLSKVQNLQMLVESPNYRQIMGVSLEQAQAELATTQARYTAAYGPGGSQVRPMQNLNLRAGLDQYFLGGGQMSGNISNQLAYLGLGANAQAAADQAARQARREARQQGSNISINVNGGISTSAQIGQSVVEAIRAYERSSGQVYASA